MALAAVLGVSDRMRRKGQDRLRSCRPQTGRRARSVAQDLKPGPAAATAPSIRRASSRRAASTAGRQRAVEECAKGASASLRTVIPAAMACPPPLTSSPSAHRVPHRPAEIDARDGAAGAGAEISRLERDRKSRPPIPLLEARRDKPDDAGMPAFGRGDDHRRPCLHVRAPPWLRLRPAPRSPARSPGARG